MGVGYLGVCFTCQGGYGDVGKQPAWYQYSDFANAHKCIDRDMALELAICKNENGRRLDATEQQFKDLMDECARKHGAKDFKDLASGCESTDVLAKMEECKQSEILKMMDTRPYFKLLE